jgi:hypothetical protein
MESEQAVQMGPLSRAIVDRGGAPLAERDPLVRYGLVPAAAGDRAATPATNFSSRINPRPWILLTVTLMIVAWFIGLQVSSRDSPFKRSSQPAASAQDPHSAQSTYTEGMVAKDGDGNTPGGNNTGTTAAASGVPLGPPLPTTKIMPRRALTRANRRRNTSRQGQQKAAANQGSGASSRPSAPKPKPTPAAMATATVTVTPTVPSVRPAVTQSSRPAQPSASTASGTSGQEAQGQLSPLHAG